MVHQKINNKGQSSLTGTVISLLLVIVVFSGFFLWFKMNTDEAGLTIDSKYNDTYAKLSDASVGISDDVYLIKDSASAVVEADSTYQVAWNGLKGLGAVLLLPIRFITSAFAVWQAIIMNLDMVPPWLKVIIEIGIVAFIVFLILSIAKGDPKLSS